MTQLPIDYNKRPYKHKYLDEETEAFNFWYIFGESADGKVVDIAQPNGDVAINVPREVAQEIIAARQAFIDVLLKHFGYDK